VAEDYNPGDPSLLKRLTTLAACLLRTRSWQNYVSLEEHGGGGAEDQVIEKANQGLAVAVDAEW
jgi:hypothetical protein